jgi:CTP-dependent riboflavin kinase
MAGQALTTANPNVITRPSTEDEVRELIRTRGRVENVFELARRLGWTRSKLIRFLDQEEGEGRITRSISSTGRALIAVSDPVRIPEQPRTHHART